MADEAKDAGPADDSSGVFGNLPSTRPGSRSPRRASAKDVAEPKKAPVAKEEPPPPPPPPPPPKQPAPPAPSTPERAEGIRSVEDLAWAGVTVAAQAATLGVRFASRALDAARKSVDRP